MLVVVFCIISVIDIFIAMTFQKTFAKVLPTAIFSIPIVLYFAGLLNNLLIGIYCIYIFCIIIVLYFIYLIIINHQEKIKRMIDIIISPGFLIFIILFLSIYLYNSNASFSFWDEWSHWGPYVKDMFLRNKFYNTTGHIATTHLSYPPFIQLFEYFYCKVVGICNMQNLYRSYQLLCYSLALVVFSDLKFIKNDIKYNIKIIFFMIIALLYFIFVNRIIDFQSNPIKSIYGDAFLALSFGYLIVSVLHFDFDDKFKIYNFILSSIALIFSKQMGTALYLLCFFILFIIVLYNKQLNKKVLTKGIFMFLIPLIFYISWKLLVFNNNIIDQFDLHRNLSIKGLIDILFNGGGESYHRIVITNFINCMLFSKFIGLTPYMWCIILATAFSITSFLVKDQYKNRIIIVSIGIIVGFILYIFSLLCLYFYTFSEYEATRLASIWRYISTYIIGLTFILGFLLIEYLLYIKKMNNIGLFILLCVVVTLYVSIALASEVNYMPKKIEESDDYIYKTDFEYMKDLPSGTKVIIVSQGDQGLLACKFKFKFFDKIFNSSSFGKPIYHEDDIYTHNFSEEEFKKYIKDFDYIYFEKIDDNFLSCYGNAFKFIPESKKGIYDVSECLK